MMINESLKRRLEDATKVIDASIEKIKMKLDNKGEWNCEDKMIAHTTVYNLFSVRNSDDFENYLLNFLCEKYENALKLRISEKVIPSLENKHGKLLWSEVVEQYLSEQVQYTKNLRTIFQHLESVNLYINARPLSLTSISKKCFCHLVWERFHIEIDMALTDWIDSGAFSEQNPAGDGDDKEESNVLKRKATDHVLKNIENKRLKTRICIKVWKRFHSKIDMALTDKNDSSAPSEKNPADHMIIDQEESNTLKHKTIDFYNVMKDVEDKRLQASFNILRFYMIEQ